MPSSLSAARKPGGLGDVGWERRHGALVEDHVPLESEIVNGGEHRVLVGLDGRHDRVPHRERNGFALQPFEKTRRGRGGKEPNRLGGRRVENGAVLGDDAIE